MGPWVYIAQQYTLYFGLFLYMAGLFGNGMTIIIFSSDRTYRTTPSTFYFLIAALHDCMQLLVNLTSRIISIGFGIDWTRMSIIWCKARLFFVVTFALIPMICQCCAAVDQYLVTSKHVSLRQLSSLKRAYWVIACVVTIPWLPGIPIILYQDISPITGTCIFNNSILAAYFPVYNLVFLCILPAICMGTFGFLTYRNISQVINLARHQAKHQMTKMVCMQTILVLYSMIPYAGWFFYLLITASVTKDGERLNKEYMASAIITLMAYFGTCGRFYVFLAASRHFRQIVKARLCFWRPKNRIGLQQIGMNTILSNDPTAIKMKQMTNR